MSKNVWLLAAVALLVPQLAVAGSVTYTTSGTFGSSTTNTSSLMPVTFTGTTQTVTTPGLGVLGTFSLGTFATCKHPKKGSICTTTDTLTLKISQLTGGHGHLAATVVGAVVLNTATGTLSWSFDPSKSIVVINGVTYLGLAGNSFLTFDVQALISGTPSVPEPKAELLLGLGSMGLMGLALVSRKVINI